VLGTYASVVPAEAFLENSRGYERHPTELADLVGIRMATASEIEKGRRWNETRITQLTGGDRVSARHMREDYFKFTCRAKFNVMANNKPGFRGVNKALLRRIYLLPFSVQITEEEKDKQLPLKLIPEYPGILAWAVKGAQLYLEKGLDPPSFVKEATTSYMDDQDVVGTWFRDHMIFDSTAGFISYADVYARYSAWARTAGEYVESLHNFNDLLHTKFNVTKSKSNNHRGFTGVRERKDSDPETI
jgi:putative DNA primase/helicase